MSIRARLLLLTLLAVALPALLAIARFLQERDHTIAATAGHLVAAAQRRADNIAERIEGTGQLLFGLARAADLASGDRAACSAFLSRVRDAHPQYTGILTIMPDGTLFCDSLQSGRDLDLRNRGYFKAALAAEDTLSMEPAFGRLTGLPVLQVALPVRSKTGDLQFVLLASLNLRGLLETSFSSVPGSWLLLMDNNGTVLARSQAEGPGRPDPSIESSALFSFISSRYTPTREIAGSDGEVDVWAHAVPATTAHAGLHVLSGVPKRSLLAAANHRFGEDLALLGAVALVIFLAVWFFTETAIRRQISRILGMAQRLSGGDLSARIAAPLPRGELGALMAVLNQTVQSLEQQRTDITALNERLRQSQRLEAVGQLTGGIAHDFNNLLTVVMGNAELLAELNRADPEQHGLADTIGAAAQRGAELTRRLLAFARKQALEPKPLDLNRMIAGMDALLRRTLGAHIRIAPVLADDLWPALVDEGQVENALLNLCLNARDAMPGGGRLTLEARNVQLDPEYAARNPDVTPGSYVMLAVSDTGQGIDARTLQRVFEPFFTTKDKDKGTGLGLAMVYGFVKQSGGHVAIYSEVGQGTTVKLYLPRSDAGEVTANEGAATAAVVGGTETILLVEDDDGVRDYALRLLRSFGYKVIEACDGPTALAIIGQRNDVDLLLTDVVMPGGMNGPALADAAVRLRPGLRVLYTSGYTDNAILQHGRLAPSAMLLTKPYRRIELDRAVRGALQEIRAAEPVAP